MLDVVTAEKLLCCCCSLPLLNLYVYTVFVLAYNLIYILYTVRGCTSGGVYVLCIYTHAR